VRVLVTGGAGYIGSHAAKALALAGYEPVVLDDLSNGHRDAASRHIFVEGNIGDGQLVRETIERYGVRAVLHFAASAYVGESVRNPRKYFENNVANTLALLGAILDCGVRTIVFSSSCATYGAVSGGSIHEETPQLPVNPYGWSKLMAEQVLRSYGRAFDLQWLALRYFNAAGADPEGELGERHDPETHLIPLVVQAALGQRPVVDVFGTDYPTPDGTAIRDYVHVTDLAEAHVLGLRYLTGGGHSQALNLGTGKGYSVKQVVEAVQDTTGRPVPVRHAPRREGDPAELVANPSLAQNVLGWQPRWSSLETIAQTAHRWHANHLMSPIRSGISAST
jgi:UDP-glucose-4-epimerase GalE